MFLQFRKNRPVPVSNCSWSAARCEGSTMCSGPIPPAQGCLPCQREPGSSPRQWAVLQAHSANLGAGWIQQDKTGSKMLGWHWRWQSISWESTQCDMLKTSIHSLLPWKDSLCLGISSNTSYFQRIPAITFSIFTVKTIFLHSTNLKEILNSSQETETSQMKARTVTPIKHICSST